MRRKQRNFKILCDKSLIFAARMLCDSQGIDSRSGLYEFDSGFYSAMQKRKLMDEVGFRKVLVDWASLDDHEVIGIARRLIEGEGICERKGLLKADPKLYDTLRRRRLLDEVGLASALDGHKDWASMDDEGLKRYTEWFIAEHGIDELHGLREADGRLYKALHRRKLIDWIGLRRRKKDWASVSDDDLLVRAKRIISEGKIGCKAELEKAHRKLYRALASRGLLEELGFRRRSRSWTSISSEELLRIAREFISDNGITGRKMLQDADRGMYHALLMRGLIAETGLQSRYRDWSAMDDGELVEFAGRSISEKGIGGRRELYETDGGLYSVLLKRRLLDRVFSTIDGSKDIESVRQVIDAMEEFG